MINLEKIHKLTKEIENELRLQLPILAVKMVESTEEIPSDAKNWLDGYDVKTKMSGHAGCVYSVVPVIKDKEITVTCPCSGIIRYAGLPDFYMIFSAPVAILEALFEAMPHLKKAWFSVPYNVVLKPEYPVRGEYAKIARMMGMSWIPTP